MQIDHGLNRTTLYAHMRRVAKGIRPGVIVKKGDEIGYVGMTGLATGPHLHYELQIDGVQINPATADLLIQKIFQRISSRSCEPRRSRSLNGSNALRSTRTSFPASTHGQAGSKECCRAR